MRLFITFLALAFSFPAFAQSAPPPPPPERATITVQGEGKSEAAPDYAAISADLVTTAASLEVATRNHKERAARAAAMIKSLEASGISIESSTFRLDRVTPPVLAGQKPAAPEFRAVTTFSLKSKNIGAIDDSITKLAEPGLFEIHGLRFALEENSKAIDEARRNAVRDARHRAEVYAEAAGAEIGDIVEITDTAQRFPIPMRQMSLAKGDVQITPPEKLDVQASVTVTWRLKSKP